MLPFFVIIFTIIGADQATKLWVVHSFSLYESKEIVPGFFSLTYLVNNGAAFSMLAGQPALWRQVFFISAAMAALIFIWVAQRSFGRQSPWYSVALALIAGGAIGNLIDRIRQGSVVDFLDFYFSTYHFPAFNVADSAITIGVALFLIKNVVLDRKQSEPFNNKMR